MNRGFEEFVKDEMKSKVYNAISDVAYEFADVPEELHKKAMEQAIEWFIIKFYENEF